MGSPGVTVSQDWPDRSECPVRRCRSRTTPDGCLTLCPATRAGCRCIGRPMHHPLEVLHGTDAVALGHMPSSRHRQRALFTLSVWQSLVRGVHRICPPQQRGGPVHSKQRITLIRCDHDRAEPNVALRRGKAECKGQERNVCLCCLVVPRGTYSRYAGQAAAPCRRLLSE